MMGVLIFLAGFICGFVFFRQARPYAMGYLKRKRAERRRAIVARFMRARGRRL